MDTAMHEAATSKVITLSPQAEAAIVFWSAPMDSMHTAQTVCAVTGMAFNTLTNWRSQGEGPKSVRRGGRAYYRKSDVLAWMQGE
ncbi:helix-turn-helix domain-containing protein [Aromatoleum toluclasticum]|uniref:helix-turn-helix transcriptional regulator n=1 Tax=Aromatoleum toluclasticum TaxID=92003 RepID=UPI001D17DED7|nr:helix-turn-helix domain-containing protein [Aromatoleum toluclasticum]MCC4115328.1 helix-turn-helix domain-containing protein [Aromatoleum toluclasticum]